MFKFNITLSIEFGRQPETRLTEVSWNRLRNIVKRRSGEICFYCGDHAPDGHADHMIPLSRGGTDSLDNLVWACPSCNASKSDKTVDEWACQSNGNEQRTSDEETTSSPLIKHRFHEPGSTIEL
jgi:5-methylcytosine-specific restriction endonuclease McrA